MLIHIYMYIHTKNIYIYTECSSWVLKLLHYELPAATPDVEILNYAGASGIFQIFRGLFDARSQILH